MTNKLFAPPPRPESNPRRVPKDEVTYERNDLPSQPDVPETVRHNIPGTQSGMFMEYFIFHPTEATTLADVVEWLKALKIAVGREVFEQLPDRVKNQCIVLGRDGKYTPFRDLMIAKARSAR